MRGINLSKTKKRDVIYLLRIEIPIISEILIFIPKTYFEFHVLILHLFAYYYIKEMFIYFFA